MTTLFCRHSSQGRKSKDVHEHRTICGEIVGEPIEGRERIERDRVPEHTNESGVVSHLCGYIYDDTRGSRRFRALTGIRACVCAVGSHEGGDDRIAHLDVARPAPDGHVAAAKAH